MTAVGPVTAKFIVPTARIVGMGMVGWQPRLARKISSSLLAAWMRLGGALRLLAERLATARCAFRIQTETPPCEWQASHKGKLGHTDPYQTAQRGTPRHPGGHRED